MRIFILAIFLILGLLTALPAWASHDPNTADADCPNTWQPQYGVTCGDPNKPEACGVSGGVPQCIATAALPTGVCTGCSIRVNCDSCIASCVCNGSGNIVCSGGSPTTFGNCQAPQTCILAGRVTANQCTGACGGCASGFEDLTPNSTDDNCIPIRPKVTLAPPDGFPDADTTTDSSLYINKTGGTGNLLRFQSGGTDRVIVTNGGQLILGLSADWTTMTQTVLSGQNLIYGAVRSASAGNILLFEREGVAPEPAKMPILRLDKDGNLEVYGALTVTSNANVGGALTVIGAINGVNMNTVVRRAGNTAVAWSCPAGQFVNGVTMPGNLLGCTAPPASGITEEVDPAFVGWRDTAHPDGQTLAALTVTGTLNTGSIVSTGSIAASSITATGTINTSGCLGAVFVGVTGQSTQGTVTSGALAGYKAANALCNTDHAGSHVCTTEEILGSINCTAPDLSTSGSAWINNGPPGYTATANDCQGWTTNAADAYGAYWAFDINGGQGWVQPCSGTARQFSCCR